jgi:hypothetical protein
MAAMPIYNSENIILHQEHFLFGGQNRQSGYFRNIKSSPESVMVHVSFWKFCTKVFGKSAVAF